MQQLISVVLPVYNGEKYLKDSIVSVINQTYTNWELLILDDCSTDSTPKICKEFCELDSRIKYYRNDTNQRLPKNLNIGFSKAKGDYLTWTSDDNMYLPTALEKMVNKLKEEKTDFVFASVRYINAEGIEFEHLYANKTGIISVIGHDSIGACFLYTRRVYEVIGDYDPSMILVEDFDYFQRIMSTFKSSYVKEMLYIYRCHDESLTGTLDKDVFNNNLEKMLLKNRPLFKKINWQQRYYYYEGLNNVRGAKFKNNPYYLKYLFNKVIFSILMIVLRGKNKILRELNLQKEE